MKIKHQNITARIALCALLVCPCLHAGAQVSVHNTGVSVTVSPGVLLYIPGQYVNETGDPASAISNDGTLAVTQNMAENSFTATAGTILFTGTQAQTIGGTGITTFHNLTIDKTAGDITLISDDVVISNNLNLSNGRIILGGHDLILNSTASITGSPGPNAYIQADQGGLVKKLLAAAEDFVFPIGDSDDYTPVTILISEATLGANAALSASVTESAHPELTCESALNRYWTLNADDISSIEYDIALNYADADVVGDENDMFTVSWDATNGCMPYQLAIASTNTLWTASGSTGIPVNKIFSATRYGALPVELTHFSGKLRAGKTHLNWSTSAEINNDYFTVERSYDGVNFEEILEIKGAGSSASPREYTAIDSEPVLKRTYYRLHQTDYNGSKTYHDIIAIEFKNQALPIRMYYTNQTNSVHIDYRGMEIDNAQLNVYNLKGQQFHSQTIHDNATTVTFNEPFPTGIYFIRMVTPMQNYYTIEVSVN